MTRQKSKFLNFFVSMMPGAGQMYLGFLKRGVSIMLYFFASIAIIFISRIEEIAFISVVIAFFAFFDSISLNGMPPEAFAQKRDGYLALDSIGFPLIKKEKTPIYFGWFLVIVGLIAVWSIVVPSAIDSVYQNEALYYTLWNIYHLTPRVVVCLIAIIGGFTLIGKKKKAIKKSDHD